MFTLFPLLGAALISSVAFAGQDRVDVKQLAETSASENPDGVGQVGEVLVETGLSVGKRSLRPGRYRVEHVALGSDHAVRFTPLGDVQLLYTPIEVPCTVERLDAEVGQTLLRMRVGGVQPQLVKIYIQGEKAAHAF